jgi:hypothetical protein
MRKEIKMHPTIDHDFIVADDELNGLEDLVYPDKAKGGKQIATRRDGDLYDMEKYINSDFELVAEMSLQPFSGLTTPSPPPSRSKFAENQTPLTQTKLFSNMKGAQPSDHSPGKKSTVSRPSALQLEEETEKMKQQIT